MNGDTLEVLRAKYSTGLLSYPSLCMNCIGTKRHEGANLTMLTTYCLRSMNCDGCKHVTDLAMCMIETACEVQS